MTAVLVLFAALAVGVVLARGLSALFVPRHLELPRIEAVGRLDPWLSVGRADARSAPRRHDVRRVVWTLARAEGRRLLLHPVFLAGVALSAAFIGFTGRESDSTAWLVVGPGIFPLALATLVVVDFAALRSRRDDTEELYDSLSVPPIVRTTAHLLSTAWAVGASALLTAAAFLYLGGADEGLTTEGGAKWLPNVLELAQGPLVVLLLGALGLMLARWLPSVIVTPVAVVAIVNLPQLEQLFDGDWHVLLLAGVASLFGALALLRHGPSRHVLATCGAAVLTILLALLLLALT